MLITLPREGLHKGLLLVEGAYLSENVLRVTAAWAMMTQKRK